MKIKLWKSTVCSVLLIQHLHKFNFKSSCSKCGYIYYLLLLLLNICPASTAAATQWCQFVWRTAFIHQGSAALIMPGCHGGRVDGGGKKRVNQDSGEGKKTKTALKTLSAWRLFCEKEHGLALPNYFSNVTAVILHCLSLLFSSTSSHSSSFH